MKEKQNTPAEEDGAGPSDRPFRKRRSMRKFGGIVALAAGGFGVLAGMLTLMVGGVAESPEDPAAQALHQLGWFEILLSSVVMVLAAICIRTPSRLPAILLIVTAVVGALYSGAIVATAMAVAVLSGIVVLFGDRPAPAGSRGPPP